MADERQSFAENLASRLRELPATERQTILTVLCRGDDELRRTVEQLLERESTSQPVTTDPSKSASGDLTTGDHVNQTKGVDTSPQARPNGTSADRNLLVAIIALQMSFATQDEVIQSMNRWVLKKETPIEEILAEISNFDTATRTLLTALAEKHLEHHKQDIGLSLQALSSAYDLGESLKTIDDSELEVSLTRVESRHGDHRDDSTVMIPTSHDETGRFRILRPHQEGGLGAISVALDAELNREVALKEVRSDFAKQQAAQERLRVEAEITGGLEHPGVVPVYALGTHNDGAPFYCMRFIRGDSLKETIASFHARKKHLSESERNLELRSLLRRFIDVCDTMSYAHNRQVLHRDLKPGNIMLGKYGETLVVDWGLAKATAVDQPSVSEATEKPVIPRSGSTAAPTMAGSTVGTPEYMSPEQADGRIDELGPETDVYSLGATLYSLLTGKPPLSGKSAADKLRKASRGEFPPPRTLETSIPKPLEAICLKAMQKDPKHRYSSASEIAKDVERWLADERVLVYREPLITRTMRTLRKNRTAAMTTAAVILVALAGLTGMNLVSRAKNIEIAERNEKIDQQNQLLQETNANLVASREAIQANFQSFRSLTADMIQKAEKELSQDPAMEDIRTWLTNQAAEIFGEFLKNDPNQLSSEEIRKNQMWFAQLFRTSANLDRGSNQLDRALEKYQISASFYAAALDEAPKDPYTRGMSSEMFRDYAITLGYTQNTALATQMINEAIKLSLGMVEEFPDAVNSKKLHGINLLEVAGLATRQSNWEEALTAASESVQILKTFIESGNTKGSVTETFLLSLLSQSQCLRELDRVEEAAQAVEEGLDKINSPDIAATPRSQRHLKARLLLEKSKVFLADGGDATAVLPTLSEAVTTWEQLSIEFTQFVFYRRYLVQARALLAENLLDSGDSDAAKTQTSASESLARELVEEHTNSAEERINLADALLVRAAIESTDNLHVQSVLTCREAIELLNASSELNPNTPQLARKLSLAQTQLEHYITLSESPNSR